MNKELLANYAFKNETVSDKLVTSVIDEEFRNILFHCVDLNNEKLFFSAIENGADYDFTDYENVSVLSYALLKKRPLFVKALIALNADMTSVDSYGWNTSMYAVSEDLELIMAILDKNKHKFNTKTSDNWSLLTRAIAFNNLPVVDYLIENKVDVNQKCLYGRSPLHYATYWGNHAAVIKLLKAHADVKATDDQGWTALFFSAYCGHTEITKEIMLLDKDSANLRDLYNKTPKTYALEEGFGNIADLL